MSRIIYPSLQAPVLDKSQEPEQVTESRWHQPWSEPVRRVFATALIVSGPIWPLPVPTPPTISVASWEQPWSQPTKSKAFTPSPELAYGYFTPTPSVVNFGWYAPLSDPTLPAKRVAPTEFAWGYFTPPIPPFGWYGPFSDPTLPKKPPTPTEFAWANFTPTPPVVPAFGWYEEFSLPRFTLRQRLSMDMACGYFTPAPTPPTPPPTPPQLVGTVGFGPALVTGPQTPPGEVYIAPRKGRGKGAGKSRSDYPKWPGWGRY